MNFILFFYLLQHSYSATKSPLLPFLVENVLDIEFVIDLIRQCQANSSSSDLMQVCAPIFTNLSYMAKHCQLSNDEYRGPIAVLREICTIKINNTRPICEIVSHLCKYRARICFK